MLKVKTKLNMSQINGLGVFLLEPVKKGQTIWDFHPAIDLRYPSNALQDDQWPVELHQILRHHGYPHEDEEGACIILGLDHDRFMNHSDDPTVISSDRGTEVASRDLKAGDELTCDYRRFDPNMEWCASFLKDC